MHQGVSRGFKDVSKSAKVFLRALRFARKRTPFMALLTRANTRVNMTNPDTYFREVWNEQKTNYARGRASRPKGSPGETFGRDRFTYTVEQLPSGCLLYQLALTR